MKQQTLGEKITQKKARIGVIGLGYVGLPTAVIFAEKGFEVTGVDRKDAVVKKLNSGGCHLVDLDLDERVRAVIESGKLKATTNTAGAVKKSDAVLIIVPTPVTEEKKPDLECIISASEEVSRGLKGGQLIVLESTVYPGVTEEVVQPILERTGLAAGKDFGLAYCPERYNPGDAKHTIDSVARIVGGITPEWGGVARKLYQSVVLTEVRQVKDIKTAEAAKVIENIQRDLNIALMNELALIFEKIGIDVMDVIDAASTKWNFNVYYPGAGVGGHCLPVDPYYLVHKAKEMGYDSKVITAGREINDYMPKYIFELLSCALNEEERPLKNSRIAVLGFSYKENVGDPRETPVKALIEELKKTKADIRLVDPYIEGAHLMQHGKPYDDAYGALGDADALVLMTAHDAFSRLDLRKVKKMMRTPIIVDGRRLFDPKEARDLGFRYMGVGLKNGR
jgi:nucleotide sugar dehydrogenase